MGVLGLIILSMLVPLVFLLGLHNGIRSAGYVSEQQGSASDGLRGYDQYETRDGLNVSEGDQSRHVQKLMRKFGPTLPKGVLRNFTDTATNKSSSRVSMHDRQQKEGLPVPPVGIVQSPKNANNTKVGTAVDVPLYTKDVDEIVKLCESKFGSYCLWRQEHIEEMKDSMVKKLKDQLFVARAYFPSIAKLPRQDKLSRELKQNIQELERVLSESTTDADLPAQIATKLQRTEAAIAKAKSLTVDCNNVDKKLRQIYDMAEDEANFHMKQSAFLYQLAVQTMPKSLHCLSMRLTLEYFRSPPTNVELSVAEKYIDPTMHHFVIFSNNVLASSVVINSTVMHAKESMKQVFHVLTDEKNYFAMRLWFQRHSFREATVEVLNMERIKLDNHHKAALLRPFLPEELRVSLYSVDGPPSASIRTEYISIFSHSHYLLPDIFRNLKKVVVLDDDVVVQQDLSALWNIDMGGKVNGAVQLCSLRFGQLKKYLGENDYDKNSCAWMTGLNVIDLARWRELDITENYRRLAQQLTMHKGSNEAIALRASLLSFEGLIYSIDGTWALSGLGHDYGIENLALSKAAVLHYNGNMKPWLELGISKYRGYWKKFLNREDRFLSECNVNS